MTAGDARGIRNRNPGNLDRVAGVRWQGEADDQSGDPRFVVFTEPKWGIRAIARTLITYQDKRQAGDGSRIDTIREIVERWAPPVENDTGAYAIHVAKLMNIGTDDEIDVYDWTTMKGLVCGIIRHENGIQPYDDATIDAGLIAAGLQAPAHKTKPPVATAAVGGLAAAGAVVTGAMDALPGGKAAYDQVAGALAPVAAVWPWLPPLLGLVAFAAVVAVAVNAKRLAKLVS